MQGFLDQVGLMTSIVAFGDRNFIFYLNGEAKKHYKTRRSCNKQIEKLFNNEYGENSG